MRTECSRGSQTRAGRYEDWPLRTGCLPSFRTSGSLFASFPPVPAVSNRATLRHCVQRFPCGASEWQRSGRPIGTGDGLQGRRRAVGRSHLGRSVGQGVEERLPNGCVVVDDQDAPRAGQNARPVGRVGARSLISQGRPIIAWPRTPAQSLDLAAVWVPCFSRSRGRLLFSEPLARSAVHPRAWST